MGDNEKIQQVISTTATSFQTAQQINATLTHRIPSNQHQLNQNILNSISTDSISINFKNSIKLKYRTTNRYEKYYVA